MRATNFGLGSRRQNFGDRNQRCVNRPCDFSIAFHESLHVVKLMPIIEL